jgi:hypothetical protein
MRRVITCGRDEKYKQNLVENLKGINKFGDIGVWVGA